MTFYDLFNNLEDADIPRIQTWCEETPTAVCIDSRNVVPGCIFVCVSGTARDGRQFAGEALAGGAVCCVGEGTAPDNFPAIRWIRVPDARRVVALLAAAFYDHPSRKLQTLAVTGTNGKTTTVSLLHALLNQCNYKCGLISTVGCDLGDEQVPADQTTPDATVIQHHLAQMHASGCLVAGIEVSSHALHQGRLVGTSLHAAAFTNLSQDHLDYHGNMEDYATAKRLLFEELANSRQGTAVINGDDAEGRIILELLREKGVKTLSYGFGEGLDLRATDANLDEKGLSFRLQTVDHGLEVTSVLMGQHNIYNLLAAIGLATTTGLPLATLVEAASLVQPVRGRLERVPAGDHPATWFVDYAHTPDALERVLDSLRPLTSGRLLVVFGCGGDRDRSKRPLMGRLAAERADIVVLTSDNPRSEDPASIIKDIRAGISNEPAQVEVEEDRRLAIRMAARLADRRGDIVLIAGKGHETTQTFADRVMPFDDRAECIAACQEENGVKQ